jgi:aldehyde dehydrogenase (NAD+)
VNCSQACVAGTRILVPASRLDEVLAVATAQMADFPAGDPRDPATAIGPMVSKRQWESVQYYIRRGIEEGARLVAGGPGRPDGLADGYFVRPTLFADVTNDMTIARQEIFGPVLSILTYRDEDDAVEIANQRYELRPACLCLLVGSRASAPRRVAARGGPGGDQRRLRAALSVRRVQAVGHRAGIRPLRP